jgi:hypothetical protein
MPEIIQCPSCRRELQVPEEFIGKPVKCPSCGLNFVTSKQNESQPLPRMGEGGNQASPAPVTVSSGGYVTPAPGRGLVITAAILLLVWGVLELMIDVVQTIMFMVMDLEDLLRQNPFISETDRQALSDPSVKILLICLGVVCGIMALVTIVGAVQMLRLRAWALGIAGSICAMLHVNSYCCILGAPFGIFALIVLCLPTTRQLFASGGSEQWPGARSL